MQIASPASAASSPSADLHQYDLGNLACFNSSIVLDSESLKKDASSYLQEVGRDSAQLLVNHLFDLPSEIVQGFGRISSLPPPSTSLPREKPIPKPRPLTKWQQFAMRKGIHKKKRNRMVLDEASEEYKPRYGFQRANDQSQDWIKEAKNDEETGCEDPWAKFAAEKKERVKTNEKQRLSNLKKAPIGKVGRVPGALDLSSAIAASSHLGQRAQVKVKSKLHVDVALELSQRSTASQGRFDDERAGEPKRKLPAPLRSDRPAAPRSITEEKQRNLALYEKIMSRQDQVDLNKAANAEMSAIQRTESFERPRKKQKR